MVNETTQPPRGKTRNDILNALKRSDGMSADQLATQLGITSMAVRKHLSALEREHLVATTLERRPVGRPARLYRLSEESEGLFPKDYDALAVDLLIDLAELDGSGKIDLLFNRRAQRTFEYLQRQVNRAQTFDDRVRALAEGMDALGYLADWEKTGPETYTVSQYNCAIQRIATEFPQACYYELETSRQLLDADVQRSCHLIAGDHMCCYVITRRA
jgi:predicted ArsR family transcriptional regulator